MAKYAVTFLGGSEVGNVATMTWGNDITGTVEFTINKPVIIDPAAAPQDKRAFLEHIVKKARGNRFFSVQEIGEGDEAADIAEVKDAAPKPKRSSWAEAPKAAAD